MTQSGLSERHRAVYQKDTGRFIKMTDGGLSERHMAVYQNDTGRRNAAVNCHPEAQPKDLSTTFNL